MTVYVDSLAIWPGARPPFNLGSCHMTADTLDELHAMAQAIGLRRAWFQDHALCPHYDLTPQRRRRATRLGRL